MPDALRWTARPPTPMMQAGFQRFSTSFQTSHIGIISTVQAHCTPYTSGGRVSSRATKSESASDHFEYSSVGQFLDAEPLTRSRPLHSGLMSVEVRPTLSASRKAEAGRPPWGSSRVAKPHLLESASRVMQARGFSAKRRSGAACCMRNSWVLMRRGIGQRPVAGVPIPCCTPRASPPRNPSAQPSD